MTHLYIVVLLCCGYKPLLALAQRIAKANTLNLALLCSSLTIYEFLCGLIGQFFKLNRAIN